MSGAEGYEFGDVGWVSEANVEHEVSGEPTDAEAAEQENAEHDRFLETYQPVITRLPEALIVEAEARAEELKAERVKTLVRDLGISEDEAREQVYGPSPAKDAPGDDDDTHAADE